MLLNVIVIKGHGIVFSQEAVPFWSFVLPTDAYVISRLTVAHFLIEFCNPWLGYYTTYIWDLYIPIYTSVIYWKHRSLSIIIPGKVLTNRCYFGQKWTTGVIKIACFDAKSAGTKILHDDQTFGNRYTMKPSNTLRIIALIHFKTTMPVWNNISALFYFNCFQNSCLTSEQAINLANLFTHTLVAIKWRPDLVLFSVYGAELQKFHSMLLDWVSALDSK